MSLRTKSCILFSKLRGRYCIELTEDIPEELAPKTIYVVGDSKHPQYAVFACPCECGRTVELNLNPDSRPCWKLDWHIPGTVSLSPSVWRKSGCHSHFFLKRSKVSWCKGL